MVTPLLTGLAIAGGAFAVRYSIRTFNLLKNDRGAAQRVADAMVWKSTKVHPGGFKNPMTKPEAALILNVRVSSEAKQIKDAHRKLMLLNHPDGGGSTFLATKINEAKLLLLQGKE